MTNTRPQSQSRLEVVRLKDRLVPAVSVTVTPTHQSGYVAEQLTFHRTGSLGAAATVPYTLSETTAAAHRAVTFGPGVADVTVTHLPVKHDGETLANTFTIAVGGGGGATASVPLVDGSANWPVAAAPSLVAVVIRKDADGVVVGITVEQVGGTSANVDTDDTATGANVATTETMVVPIGTLTEPPAACAPAQPDQSAILRGYLTSNPPDVQAFCDAALSAMEAPFTQAELKLLEDVLRGRYGNLGGASILAKDYAATAIATHLFLQSEPRHYFRNSLLSAFIRHRYRRDQRRYPARHPRPDQGWGGGRIAKLFRYGLVGRWHQPAECRRGRNGQLRLGRTWSRQRRLRHTPEVRSGPQCLAPNVSSERRLRFVLHRH